MRARACVCSEFCAGGCGLWNSIPTDTTVGNERSHYTLPGDGGEVILYRDTKNRLYASVRAPGDTSQVCHTHSEAGKIDCIPLFSGGLVSG
jgi:hypothetical protein